MTDIIKALQCGHEVRTRDGREVKFVAILAENIPARLLVDVAGVLENYYIDGSYRGVPKRTSDWGGSRVSSDMDLEIVNNLL